MKSVRHILWGGEGCVNENRFAVKTLFEPQETGEGKYRC